MREYFSRLYNTLYLIVLIPLILFTYLYLEAQQQILQMNEATLFLSVTISLVFWALLVAAHFIFRKDIKNIHHHHMDKLNEKLNWYKKVVLHKYLLTGVSCLVLTIGFWFEPEAIFIALFMIAMIAFSWWWPSPKKFMSIFKLTKEEKEKIMNQKESVS